MQIQQEAKRNKTISHSIQYLSATIVTQGIGILRSVLLPVLFIPAQMGIWNLMGVIIGYGANAQLGLLDGMNKMIPLLRGQSKPQEIEVVKNSVFWLNSSLGALAAIALLISSFFVPAAYRFYLCLVAVIVFIELIFFYQFSLLRANSLFGILSKGIVIFSIGSSLFVLSLAFLFHDRVLGALVGLALAHIVVIGYWFVKLEYRFPLQIDFSVIRRSFVIGIPLITVGALNSVFISIDRWMIAANLGVVVLGYYALGIMVNSFLSIIPGSVASTLYPKMLERFAIRKDFSDSENLLFGALRVSAVVMLITISSVSFIVPLLIKFFLPKYLPSILIIKILILGSFFYSLSTIAGIYLISIDKQRYLMMVQIALIALLIISYSVALKLGYGILSVSGITAAGYSIFGLSYIFLSIYFVKGGSCSSAVRAMMRLIIPFLLMAILIIVAEIIIGTHRPFWGYVQFSGIFFLVTMCIVIPIAWVLNYDKELVELLRKELKLLRFSILTKLHLRRVTE